MAIRRPIVAGQFYGGTREQCLREIEACLAEGQYDGPLPDGIVAGIVPHAGWVFSGALAAMVFESIRKTRDGVDTFVIFGAVHSWYGSGEAAAVYDSGTWQTPLGEVEVDAELAQALIAASGAAEANCSAHVREHSIEVQVPFIQHLFPQAKILPVMIAPTELSAKLGTDAAGVIKAAGRKIVCIGSTDLTHYGPRYGFDPKGVGEKAVAWAKDVNDKALISLAVGMEAERIVDVSEEKMNACGAGAVAATAAAARAMGRKQGVLLAHRHSNEVMKVKFGQSNQESVGYAAIVY
ncbi:MAG TPA: AmmeMemoRadiSam system protein B [Sedimentisphaerales bacterium]|nr:AmmeMemoRadiSam system protein B [Sedimentisphaerales bacterium]